MAGTSSNSVLYILDTSDNIILIRSSVATTIPISLSTRASIGSTLLSNINSVPFGDTTNNITGTSLLNVYPGLWAITFKWKIVTDNSGLGNGLNYVK
jgi:hypothetical protein